MIPRRELVNLVRNRLQENLPLQKVEQLMTEIEGLGERWEEVNVTQLKTDSCLAVNCFDCWLEEQLRQGAVVKLFFNKKRLAY